MKNHQLFALLPPLPVTYVALQQWTYAAATESIHDAL